MNARTLANSLLRSALFAPLATMEAPAQAASSAPVKNIVLVHGAWADGSSWSKVVPLLQAKGFHVACTQHALSSIADDVAATERLVNAQDGPVMLVGHSYGGAIITEAGNNPKVAGLVYVAAFAPEEGETLAGMSEPTAQRPSSPSCNPSRTVIS